MAYEHDGTPVDILTEFTAKDSLLGTDEGLKMSSFTLDALGEAVYKWIAAKEAGLTPSVLQAGQVVRGLTDGEQTTHTFIEN